MQKLNTTLVYILSVVGFLCCCIGLGAISSLIALIVANKQLKKAKDNPEEYSNVAQMKTAKIVAIVALVVSGLFAIYLIYIVVMLTTNPEYACEFFTEMVNSIESNPSVPAETLEMYEQWRDEACSNLAQ